VTSIAALTAAGYTLAAGPSVNCGCSMTAEANTWANQHNDMSPMADGERRRYVVPTYWSYGCWTGEAVCQDGWRTVQSWATCPSVPSSTATGDSAGWGNWEPIVAFTLQGCNQAGDAGHCQVSGTSTNDICPQWSFGTSAGAYNGCLRRKCDHPNIAAAYIPGC